MKCRICNREALEKYCELHEKAYRNIVQKYDSWKRAMDVSWKEYLNEIAKNPYTGSWAKEVAEQLLKNEDR
ncbi:MAG: DNA topoisomerase I [Candidatus Bathyarchaeota archaeon BA2]|nr:MAG: DNA topoisomerase I [Candidatus Bathyarchaeota archaeon BA2]